jgi:hypothetical protein
VIVVYNQTTVDLDSQTIRKLLGIPEQKSKLQIEKKLHHTKPN